MEDWWRPAGRPFEVAAVAALAMGWLINGHWNIIQIVSLFAKMKNTYRNIRTTEKYNIHGNFGRAFYSERISYFSQNYREINTFTY